MDNKVCAFCFAPFTSCRPKYPQVYCTVKCCNRARAAAKKAKDLRFKAPYEMFVESEQYGGQRAVWIAKQVGCSQAHVYVMKKYVGYEWLPCRTTLLNAPTMVERNYVRALGCLVCGEKRFVDAAHFVAARDGGSNQRTNMIPLCPTHHRLYDRSGLFEKELELILLFILEKFPNVFENIAPVQRTFKNKGFTQFCKYVAKQKDLPLGVVAGAFVQAAATPSLVVRPRRKPKVAIIPIDTPHEDPQPLLSIA